MGGPLGEVPLIYQMYNYLCRHHNEDDAWAMAQRLYSIVEGTAEGNTVYG